jgi:hypothetical protein
MPGDQVRAHDPSEDAGYGGAVEGVGADTPEQEQQQPHLERARQDREAEADEQVDEVDDSATATSADEPR